MYCPFQLEGLSNDQSLTHAKDAGEAMYWMRVSCPLLKKRLEDDPETQASKNVSVY